MVKNDINGGRNRVRFYMIGERVNAVAAALERIAAQRGWDRIDVASDPHTVELVVLAVSAVTGVSPEVQRQLEAARSAGIPNLVVAVDQIDELQDPELLDLAELEVRESVRRSGYPGEAPIVKPSTHSALEGSSRAASRMAELLNAIEAARSGHR